MALKAYKHLTDGEVKIVASGSAEETSLLADTVTGSSYLQLTSTGHSQEIAAAQGTALWVDVTSDLGSGGGGSSAEVFEVTNLPVLSGTDWSVTGHQIGELVVTDPGGLLVSQYLELAADPADFLYFSGFDVLSADYNFDINIYGGGADDAAMQIQPGVGSTRVGSSGVCDIERTWTTNVGDPPDYPLTIPVGFVTNGPTTVDITVVRARLEVTAI